MKLRRKQSSKYAFYGYFIAAGGMFYIFIKTVQLINLKNANFTIINNIATTEAFIIVGLISLGFYKSPLALSKVSKTKKIIRNILEQNDFYYENKSLKEIMGSMTIKFQFANNQLILKVFSNGAKYTSHLTELTSVFQTAFNMTVISVQNDFPNHVTYILDDDKDNFIDATNSWDVTNE